MARAYFSVINDKEKNYHARGLTEIFADSYKFLYFIFMLPLWESNAAYQATNANPVNVFEDLRQLQRSFLVREYTGESLKPNV